MTRLFPPRLARHLLAGGALLLAMASPCASRAYGGEPAGLIEDPAVDAGPTKKTTRRRRTKTRRGSAAPAGAQPPLDAARMPTFKSPPVVVVTRPRGKSLRGRGTAPALGGFSRSLAEPAFVDKRRRRTRGHAPPDFGHTLRPGERFRFDVTFAGNPAGLAEAQIIRVEPDPRGPPPAGAPTIRIEGHARTSGVVSLLASVTDDIVTYVDARTGAAISSVNVLHYSGWAPRKYKHRVTEHAYEGRGHVRITDTKDDKTRKKLKLAPPDTFDPMAAMAWVRSLRLAKGEKVTAHVIDGTTLMRVEIESGGRTRLDSMPSVGLAMGLSKDDTQRVDGRITRVDRYDQPIPGKRVFSLRAWLSDDDRRVPLVMESDMWVGAIRLELSGYDPPTVRAKAPDKRPTSTGRSAAAPSAASPSP